MAIYSGDPFNTPTSRSTCGDPNETVTVSKAHTTLVTLASPSAAPGRPITDRATLDGGAHPTGSITFKLYGPDDRNCSGGSISTSSKSVDGNGTYTSDSFTPTADGIYRWVAIYSSDPNNDGAMTSCGDTGEEVVVAPAPPTHPALATAPSGGAPPARRFTT